MGRAYSMYGEKRDAYSLLVGKSVGKIPLVRPRHKWEDNIKTEFR
jgi:hypothetical protein